MANETNRGDLRHSGRHHINRTCREDLPIAESIISYMKTKFFHFLLGLKKITQHTTQKTYSFVPMQDFSKCWTDEELYKKYNLTQDEIDFIESMIRPMD